MATNITTRIYNNNIITIIEEQENKSMTEVLKIMEDNLFYVGTVGKIVADLEIKKIKLLIMIERAIIERHTKTTRIFVLKVIEKVIEILNQLHGECYEIKELIPDDIYIRKVNDYKNEYLWIVDVRNKITIK